MSETVAARDAARRLTWQILIALLLGGSFGVLLNWLAPHFPWMQTYIVDGALKLIGGLFRNGLQLLVVPLVFFSLVAGTASLRDPASLGRLGYKTLGLYLLTTLLAVSMALVLAMLIQPGSGVIERGEVANFTPPPAPPVLDVFLGMVTRNPIESLATGNMLQIIVFAVLLGIALVMAGEAGERATASVQDWNQVVLQLVTIIMK
ncbi:MAG: cation:dicarboxylase symporter family transporter, partial [Xanthomonadales bacterium]|nr:cation:dicarboxylase symporter family transporter [Xanthomonadales bacterium]